MSKQIKFEEAFNRLEDIARRLESGEISLEESMGLYEEGMKLIQWCNEKLDTAEQKVLKLSKTGDGTFQTEAMDDPVKDE